MIILRTKHKQKQNIFETDFDARGLSSNVGHSRLIFGQIGTFYFQGDLSLKTGIVMKTSLGLSYYAYPACYLKSLLQKIIVYMRRGQPSQAISRYCLPEIPPSRAGNFSNKRNRGGAPPSAE